MGKYFEIVITQRAILDSSVEEFHHLYVGQWVGSEGWDQQFWVE